MRLRPRAEVICFKRNRVLCGYNTELNCCFFPGGGIDPNESAVEAAKRECLEESDRRLINCTTAHPPTTQVWPDDYQASNEGKWGSGFHGGYTHWMTGSCSDDLVHKDPEDRHEDYETIYEMKPVKEVLDRLQAELGRGTDWEEDVKTRIAILKNHLQMHKVVKEAEAPPQSGAISTPRLSFFARPSPGET